MPNLPSTRDQVDIVERELTGQAVRSSLYYLAAVSATFGILSPYVASSLSGVSVAVAQVLAVGIVVVLTMILFLLVFRRFRQAVDRASRSLETSRSAPARIRFVQGFAGLNSRIAEMDIGSGEEMRREYAILCPAPSSIRVVDSISGVFEGAVISDPSSGKPAAVLLPTENSREGRLVVVSAITDREAAMHLMGRRGICAILAVPLIFLAFTCLVPAGMKVGNLPLGLLLGILAGTIGMSILQGKEIKRLQGTKAPLISNPSPPQRNPPADSQ